MGMDPWENSTKWTRLMEPIENWHELGYWEVAYLESKWEKAPRLEGKSLRTRVDWGVGGKCTNRSILWTGSHGSDTEDHYRDVDKQKWIKQIEKWVLHVVWCMYGVCVHSCVYCTEDFHWNLVCNSNEKKKKVYSFARGDDLFPPTPFVLPSYRHLKLHL